MSRILGIDPGEKRVGLALSDPLGIIASPFGKIEFSSQSELISELERICKENEVSEIVIGYPVRTSGKKGKEAILAEELAVALEQKLGIKVHLWDERLTTQQAERALLEADLSRKKRKKLRDKVSASLILDSFLQARKR